MRQVLLLSSRGTGLLWFQRADYFGFLLPDLGQGGCPIVHWGHLKASFAVSGCNYHPFPSSAHSQDSMQILLIYTPYFQPSVPKNHFHLGHPYNSLSWTDSGVRLLTLQEGFFIGYHSNQFYLFLTTCFILPPPSIHSLTKAKCQAQR